MLVQRLPQPSYVNKSISNWLKCGSHSLSRKEVPTNGVSHNNGSVTNTFDQISKLGEAKS